MTSEPEVSKRFVVHGRVQGVGFRDSVCRLARGLGGVKGHVRNLKNGSLEVCVTAEPRKVEDLRAFLLRGPPIARIDRLEELPLDPPAAGSFCALYGG